jgi:hypothetical protein
MRAVRILTSALLALVLGALGVLVATPAHAAWHANAHLYAYWNHSTAAGLVDLNQQIRFTAKAKYTYLATAWRYEGHDNASGGYAGVQTNGYRFDGTIGDMAIFSLWDATAARPAPGAECGQFGGEGVGWSCRRAMQISTTTWYELRVVRLESTAEGQWWSAGLLDTTTGQALPLGDIRVAPTKTAMVRPMNFSEYFGPAVRCDRVPLSTADYKPPAGNATDGSLLTSTYRSGYRGACTGGSVSPQTYGGVAGARIVMGGRR